MAHRHALSVGASTWKNPGDSGQALRGREAFGEPALPLAEVRCAPPNLVSLRNVSAVVAYCSLARPWTAPRMTRHAVLQRFQMVLAGRVAADWQRDIVENHGRGFSEASAGIIPPPA